VSLWSGWKVFKGENRQEAKDKRQKARDKRQKARDKRQKARGKRQETKGKRQEAKGKRKKHQQTLTNLNILRELFDIISRKKIELTQGLITHYVFLFHH
jgi:uncharacterized coiled-coil DUF342 family protein